MAAPLNNNSTDQYIRRLLADEKFYIEKIVNHPSYKAMDTDSAIQLLLTKEVGTYIFRESSRGRPNFAISILTAPGRVENVLIKASDLGIAVMHNPSQRASDFTPIERIAQVAVAALGSNIVAKDFTEQSASIKRPSEGEEPGKRAKRDEADNVI